MSSSVIIDIVSTYIEKIIKDPPFVDKIVYKDFIDDFNKFLNNESCKGKGKGKGKSKGAIVKRRSRKVIKTVSDHDIIKKLNTLTINSKNSKDPKVCVISDQEVIAKLGKLSLHTKNVSKKSKGTRKSKVLKKSIQNKWNEDDIEFIQEFQFPLPLCANTASYDEDVTLQCNSEFIQNEIETEEEIEEELKDEYCSGSDMDQSEKNIYSDTDLFGDDF